MSSTTPPPPQTSAPTPPRASLTERRKAETRMEIARAAAGLFVRHGLRATRAEDIAQAAGIAPRTFYRYFATKEEAVAPLYAAGAQRWVEAVRAAPADASVLRALEHGVRHTLTPGVGVSASSWEWVRTLLRLAEANPSLRRVWAEVCQASERTLGEVLAERGAGTGASPGDDNVAAAPEPRSIAPEPRFTAAVASAAVRTALEGWAEGDGPVEGPGSPAELALRNLDALRDFPWEA
ncbi:TetR/AcrR family transcriptional regulator [Streptomyces afghaniensis]|uniref:TetR/AcrR family transcriptional regulator n=1 Tax=Streptomyces afghaniensis TaxID=66865 RepID=UPI002784036E|nr:TetR family transcriptional regulator [Streptomyces afghaniensis]MDQ1018664.1 AcrR family transcriptional regulator [Streptomyces afghaniensis]